MGVIIVQVMDMRIPDLIKLIKTYFSYLGKVPLCNKKPERAPKILGFCFLLCWRCLGLLVGGVIGSFMYMKEIINYKNNALFIFLLGGPFIIDISMQILRKQSTNERRFLTGILLGIALANLRFI